MIKRLLNKYHKLVVVGLMLLVSLSFLVGTTTGLSAAPDLAICLPEGAYISHTSSLKGQLVSDKLSLSNLPNDIGEITGQFLDNKDSGTFNIEGLFYDPVTKAFAEDLVLDFKLLSGKTPSADVLQNLRLVYNTAPGNFIENALPRAGWNSLPIHGTLTSHDGTPAIRVTISKATLLQNMDPGGKLGAYYFKLQYHDAASNSNLGLTNGPSGDNCGLVVAMQLQDTTKIYSNTTCDALGVIGGYNTANLTSGSSLNINQNYFTCSYQNGVWTASSKSCGGNADVWAHCGGVAGNGTPASGKELSEFSQYGTNFCAPCIASPTIIPEGGICSPPTASDTGLALAAKLNQCETSSQQHKIEAQNGTGNSSVTVFNDGDRNMTCVPSSIAGDTSTRCLYTAGNKPGPNQLGTACIQGQNECSSGFCVGSVSSGGIQFEVGKPGICVASLNARGTYSSECDAYQTTLDALKDTDPTSYAAFKAAYVTSGTGGTCVVTPAPRCGGKDSLSGTAVKSSNSIQVLLSGCVSDPTYGYVQPKYVATVGVPNSQDVAHQTFSTSVIPLSNVGKIAGQAIVATGDFASAKYIKVCATPLTDTTTTTSTSSTLCTNIAVTSSTTANGGDTTDTGSSSGGSGQDLQGREACTTIEDGNNASQCDDCLISGGTWTGLGCIATTPEGIFASIIRIVLGVMGGVTLLRLIYLGYLYQSADDKKIAEARAGVISTLAGILVVLFSILILRIIGVNILNVVPAGFFG